MEELQTIALYLGAIAVTYTFVTKIAELWLFWQRRKIFNDSLRIHNIYRNKYMHDVDLKNIEDKITTRIFLSDRDLENSEKIEEIYKDFVRHRIHISPTFDRRIIIDKHEYDRLNGVLKEHFDITYYTDWKTITSAGLISSTIRDLLSSTSKPAFDRSTIVGLLVGKKLKRDSKAYLFLMIAALIQSALGLYGSSAYTPICLGVVLIFIGAITLNQKALDYRIKKGFYGTTAYEAKEIVEFISEHSDKSDFTDGGQIKKIAPDAEEVSREVVVYGGVLQQ